MATVDEILARQAYAAGDDIWTEDSRYPSYRLYVEPEYVPVTNKRIADFNDQISVTGEQNARFVGFQLPRYDDGIDLTAQNLYIHYQTAFGGSDSVPCNVSWSDNHVRICWMVPAQATQEPDRVQMMIYATGTNSAGDRVIWKTLPASYTIHDGLEIGGGIPEPDTSWYEQFVQQMEDRVSTAQGYADDAQASRTEAAGSAAAASQSAAASAQALQDNKDYVESQKETFVGYNKRDTDLKYANALVGSASGTGRVTVGDAWEAPIPGMDISGKSEQFSTTGAQLFDASLLQSKTVWGITFTNNGDGSFSVKGTATNYSNTWSDITLSPGNYIASGTKEEAKFFVRVFSDEITYMDYRDQIFSITGNEFGVKAYIQVSNGKTVNEIIWPMLNAGATPKPWEPYTGGKPSPSPEYPQPINGTGTVSTGAQMLDLVDKTVKVYGITMTLKDGVSSLKGTATGSTTLWYLGSYLSSVVLFVLSPGTYTVTDCRIWWSDGTTNVSKQGTFTIAEPFEVTGISTATYSTGSVVDETLRPMLNTGATPKPWEPYTGGKPSPSPEYPQLLDVTVTGAQLLDLSGVERQQTVVGITYTVDSANGTITANGTSTQVSILKIPISIPAGEKVYFGVGNISAAPSGTFQTIFRLSGEKGVEDSSNTYLSTQYATNIFTTTQHCTSCHLRFGAGETVNNFIIKPMVALSDKPLPWKPYAGYQTAALTLTEPLHGIGDVRDRIMCRDGVWGIERYISQNKLTSSIVSASSGGVTTSNNVIDNRYTVITCEAWKNIIKKGLYENGKKTIGFCTIAPPGMINDWNTSKNGKENVYTINAAGAMYISIPISALDITADTTREEVTAAVKQYVTGHDVFVGFVLDTPTWEQLPADTQSAINALTTYTGTTHVTITAGGPEPDVGLEYVMDTRAVIADLQAQIDTIRNGGTT